jgi:nitroreductase
MMSKKRTGKVYRIVVRSELSDRYALILLAVVEEGLGACFVGSFYDEEVQEVLSLPQEVRPIGIIPIGYCAEGPRKFRRRSREQIVHRDRYGRR